MVHSCIALPCAVHYSVATWVLRRRRGPVGHIGSFGSYPVQLYGVLLGTCSLVICTGSYLPALTAGMYLWSEARCRH